MAFDSESTIPEKHLFLVILFIEIGSLCLNPNLGVWVKRILKVVKEKNIYFVVGKWYIFSTLYILKVICSIAQIYQPRDNLFWSKIGSHILRSIPSCVSWKEVVYLCVYCYYPEALGITSYAWGKQVKAQTISTLGNVFPGQLYTVQVGVGGPGWAGLRVWGPRVGHPSEAPVRWGHSLCTCMLELCTGNPWSWANKNWSEPKSQQQSTWHPWVRGWTAVWHRVP